MSSKDKESHFIVTYRDPAKLADKEVLTLKVKTIGDSNLGLGFVRLSDFLFEEGGLIVDPTTDHLRTRFEHTKSLHIAIHHIFSIEEVGQDHKGLRFQKNKSNLYMLPPQNPEL